MKTFLILVTSSPTASANCYSALQFAKAAAEQSYKVVLFFYGEGIHNANAFMQPPGDELNLHKQWAELAQDSNVELIVCASAAIKRGVITEEDAQQTNAFNLSAPFHAGGLAEFSQLSQTAEHFIQF
ncbi:sulfurtransferase complex subunit TusD [Planctobacterium marinum]|uniref:sulfurtransferase complex subunit TusD n=1 Tax=Planctobacterium marinum TaxID=1631968 RepID=UPI001E49C815|nr:sulfurtransferase complex subunit TusD [Planctobacterium marinum]MCC2604111.1 sulfurtransferase complex subunit TusD [Planctobacterium marinum]